MEDCEAQFWEWFKRGREVDWDGTGIYSLSLFVDVGICTTKDPLKTNYLKI